MAAHAIIPALITTLTEKLSYPDLAAGVGMSEGELKKLATNEREPSPSELWNIVRACYDYDFFRLLPEHGMTPVTFDLSRPYDLRDPPIGFAEEPPAIPLRKDPVTLAGYTVDFPLALPASMIAANSQWIEFYARRGFDILTYKTVRTRPHKEHKWPHWVYIKDPVEIAPSMALPGGQALLQAPLGFRPDNMQTISMANSFGIPSLPPEWWQNDVRKARGVIKEGQQVLIVSIVSSVTEGDKNDITADFVKAARMAKASGAQIIEANYSCPNAVGEPGDIYQYPDRAAFISEALHDELGNTPLFIKIGYLPKKQLYELVKHNAPYIAGIVAINTISAKIIGDNATETFPGRPTAGVSGWAIRARAQEVARNLVAIRKELTARRDLKEDFAVLGLGGVLTKEDYNKFRAIGVTAVESCTGAFLNRNLGIDIRRYAKTATINTGTPSHSREIITGVAESSLERGGKVMPLDEDRKPELTNPNLLDTVTDADRRSDLCKLKYQMAASYIEAYGYGPEEAQDAAQRDINTIIQGHPELQRASP